MRDATWCVIQSDIYAYILKWKLALLAVAILATRDSRGTTSGSERVTVRSCTPGVTKFERMISVRGGPPCAIYSGGTDAVEVSDVRKPTWLPLTCANPFADADIVSDRKSATVGDQRCSSFALT
jgi:hypothetical protein